MNENCVIQEYDLVVYPRKIWIVYDCPTDVLDDAFPLDNGTWNAFDGYTFAETWSVTRKSDGKLGELIRFAKKEVMTAGLSHMRAATPHWTCSPRWILT